MKMLKKNLGEEIQPLEYIQHLSNIMLRPLYSFSQYNNSLKVYVYMTNKLKPRARNQLQFIYLI